MNTISIKIAVMGSYGIGKTCFTLVASGRPYCNNNASTIGIDLIKKEKEEKGVTKRLIFIDTAGSEKFRSAITNMIRTCEIFILAFKVTEKKEIPEQFKDHLLNLYDDIIKSNSSFDQKFFILIGTQADNYTKTFAENIGSIIYLDEISEEIVDTECGEKEITQKYRDTVIKDTDSAYFTLKNLRTIYKTISKKSFIHNKCYLTSAKLNLNIGSIVNLLFTLLDVKHSSDKVSWIQDYCSKLECPIFKNDNKYTQNDDKDMAETKYIMASKNITLSDKNLATNSSQSKSGQATNTDTCCKS